MSEPGYTGTIPGPNMRKIAKDFGKGKLKANAWGPKKAAPAPDPDLNRWQCPTCDYVFETIHPLNWFSPSCPTCNPPKDTPPQYMKRCYDLPENEAGRAKQRAYMETPEVKAKLKSGEYEIDRTDY